MCDPTHTKENITKVLHNYNVRTSSDHETTEVMNNYFVSVFVSDVNVTIQHLEVRNTTSINETITVNTHAINRQKPTKSPGPDNIHPMLISRTKDVIIHHLLGIFQKSHQEGEIPKEWKTANVTGTPIFTKCSRSEPPTTHAYKPHICSM